jgi:hypothetical protein
MYVIHPPTINARFVVGSVDVSGSKREKNIAITAITVR